MNKPFIISIGFDDIEVPELVFRIDEGNFNRAEELLSEGVDPMVGANEITPLYWASHKGNLPLITLLLKYIEQSSLSPVVFKRCVEKSISSAREDIFHFWMSLNIPAFQTYKHSFLHSAISAHALPIADELFKVGADPNHVDEITGTACLHVACRKLNFDLCTMLISNGARPNQKNRTGQTAIEILDELKGLNRSAKADRERIRALLETA